jgi:hypothetical protein
MAMSLVPLHDEDKRILGRAIAFRDNPDLTMFDYETAQSFAQNGFPCDRRLCMY